MGILEEYFAFHHVCAECRRRVGAGQRQAGGGHLAQTAQAKLISEWRTPRSRPLRRFTIHITSVVPDVTAHTLDTLASCMRDRESENRSQNVRYAANNGHEIATPTVYGA